MPEMPESSRGGSDTARGMPDAVNEIRQGVAGNPIPEALETPGSDPSNGAPSVGSALSTGDGFDPASSFDSASGLDLRPLGSDSANVPSLGATPLVPVETDGLVRVSRISGLSADCGVLPTVPGAVSRDSARLVRTKVDPIGHRNSVVACPVITGLQGESSPLINGAIHIFLSPGALMRQLGGPAGAQQQGLKVTRGRLLTLLDEGLKNGSECAGFWLYGLEEQMCFLPVAELEPLSETIETVLLLARASTGGISMERAVRELSSRMFFHTGGWGSGAAGVEPSMSEDEVAVSETIEPLQLFVSPVSLLKSGHIGQVATVSLAEVNEILGERAGVVVEPGMGYALSIPRELLPESESSQEKYSVIGSSKRRDPSDPAGT